MQFIIKQGLSSLPDARNIRQMVFVEEQGFQNEFDDHDKQAYHIVVYDNEKPIATARTYKQPDDTYPIGRVAVLKEYRKYGIGRMMITNLHDFLHKRGVNRTFVCAQVTARGFYEKLGYEAEEGIVDDEGVPHINMWRIMDGKGVKNGSKK